MYPWKTIPGIFRSQSLPNQSRIESGKRNRFLGQVDDQKDIESLLKKRLGQELLSLLERISQAAENFGVSVYEIFMAR